MPGSILVVCTGNICRSPMAEGFLRAFLEERLGDDAPLVASAGLAAWEGSGPTPEAVAAAAELGVDISGHRARGIVPELVQTPDLVLAMTAGQRGALAESFPEVAGRIFTLKELVRILEADPAPEAGSLAEVVRRADELRRRGVGRNPDDESVADPFGSGFETYRAVAWELREWCRRLVDASVGTPARTGEA